LGAMRFPGVGEAARRLCFGFEDERRKGRAAGARRAARQGGTKRAAGLGARERYARAAAGVGGSGMGGERCVESDVGWVEMGGGGVVADGCRCAV